MHGKHIHTAVHTHTTRTRGAARLDRLNIYLQTSTRKKQELRYSSRPSRITWQWQYELPSMHQWHGEARDPGKWTIDYLQIRISKKVWWNVWSNGVCISDDTQIRSSGDSYVKKQIKYHFSWKGAEKKKRNKHQFLTNLHIRGLTKWHEWANENGRAK
jgi:hypothetical protein